MRTSERRMRLRFFSRSAAAAALLALAAAAGCGASVGESTLARWHAEVGGKHVTFEEDLFQERVVSVGLWKPCRFQEVVGFGIYTKCAREEGDVPVLLVHGHASGPAKMETLGDALERRGFAAYYAYYATGQDLELTARLMEKRLGRLSREEGIDEMPVVAYSMGGLVVRRFLGERHDANTAPRVPSFVSLATPYGGIEVATNWKVKPGAPPSWDDMSCGKEFMKHLFDNPLPGDTEFHLLYGVNEEGEGDGLVSEKSAVREEAVREAAETVRFDVCDHRAVVQKKEPVHRVMEILEDYRAGG